jgi:maleate isomerase
VSAQLRTRLGDAGIQTPQFGSFNEASETKVAHIAPESVLEAAVSLYQRGGCEAIFLSCTNLQTLDVLAEIEARCGCRVFSSNLVLAWHMLTLAGLAPRDKNIASLLHA